MGSHSLWWIIRIRGVGLGRIGMMRDMLTSFEMGFLVGLGVIWGLRGSSGCDFGVWCLVEKYLGNCVDSCFKTALGVRLVLGVELERFMAFWVYLGFPQLDVSVRMDTCFFSVSAYRNLYSLYYLPRYYTWKPIGCTSEC
jgi:hypothetical protein